MIFAELRGKLGVDYSRAHERAEDVITSNVFGLLRYLSPEDGLLPILRRARRVHIETDSTLLYSDLNWLDNTPCAGIDVEFWPTWSGNGQPDIFLALRDKAGHTSALVVVEAKLHSPKSGQADEQEELTDENSADPDQLVRYWRGLQSLPGSPEIPRWLIYLTKHGAPPVEELTESLRRAPTMQLAWLSWRDIWAVAELASAAYLPAADLAQLLAYKGLKNFNGFHAEPWQAPSAARFWKSRAWFTDLRPWNAAAASTSGTGFWSSAGESS
jgi:hypothetical protein